MEENIHKFCGFWSDCECFLCSSCELARALVNHGQSMNIAIFSTWDLREQGRRKSYVARYWANEELLILQMFSCKLRQ